MRAPFEEDQYVVEPQTKENPGVFAMIEKRMKKNDKK
jgi:hypothetical protein